METPLLTAAVHELLTEALRKGENEIECSVDLGRTSTAIGVDSLGWTWQDRRYPYMRACKERTIYYWDGSDFAPVSRYEGALIKLVPTDWGPPTFEIDGVKMLPTA